MSRDPQIAGRSALQLAGIMGGGVLDAEEVAARTFAAIRACDDQAIFTRLTEDRATGEARMAAHRARAGRPRGLLDGVPVAWKDLFDLQGVTTTAGSRVLAGDPPAACDATVVARLTAAGMVTVGHVNMTEFAYSGIGLNPHYGTPRNAHSEPGDPRAPGGSSSGSAVVVARGLVPVAIGSDTGGSVRIPAAFNGIIGLKTSTGRYPTDGVFPLSTTLDTVGVFTRTVADAAIVDAALCGLPAPTAKRRPLGGQRIIVPTNIVFDDAQPAVLANFEAALARLAEAGAVVERTHVAAFDEVLAVTAKHGNLTTAEAYTLHRERLVGPQAAGMDRRVAARAGAGADIAMTDYVTILQQRRRLIAEAATLFAGGAVIAYPTVVHTAPSIAALEADDALFYRINARTLRNTNLGNFLDWCGISFPSGTDAAGLPTALLLSGPHGGDDALLSLALSAEDVIRGDAHDGD
jgi:aspartyl-tRNA(Asn)/glutamyl-tRNA(Gln) amidotransferase subunit A